MRRRVRLAFSVVLGLLACEGDGSPTIDVRVIDVLGGNPIAGGGYDRIRIDVVEDDLPRSVTSEVTGDTFDLGVLFEPDARSLELTVGFTGSSPPLIGATPRFLPGESGATVALVVGVPGSCEPMPALALSEARVDLGAAVVGTFVLAIGGVGASGASTKREFLDALLLGAGDLGAHPSSLGATRATPCGSSEALVLAEPAGAFLFDLAVEVDRVTPVTLHAGAGLRSAIATLSSGVAVVVGGFDGAVAVTGVSFVSADGSVAFASLSSARDRPAVVPMGDGVLVAGGGADLPFEWLHPDGGHVTTSATDSGARGGPLLLLSPDGTEALLAGGRSAGDVPRDDVWLIRGCPAACSVVQGRTWSDARDDAVAIPRDGIVVGGDGPSDLVERAVFDGADSRLEPLGTLMTARRGHAVVPHSAHGFFVLAGEAASGPLRDVEVCFFD